jgi:hypothetical protein
LMTILPFYEVGRVNEKREMPRMAMRGEGGDIPPEAEQNEGICRVQPRREGDIRDLLACRGAGAGAGAGRRDQRDVTLATQYPT